jgi:hypothetical protein
MRIAKLFVRRFNSAALSREFMELSSHLVIEFLKAFNDSMPQ